MSAPRVVGHRAQRRVLPAELAFQLVVQGSAGRGTAVARPGEPDANHVVAHRRTAGVPGATIRVAGPQPAGP